MARTDFIDEVEIELEFGGGSRHVDIRFGILNYGVLDRDERATAREITIGVVGTPQLIDGFLEWLDACAGGVAAKQTNKANLFPRFPGFGAGSPFNATWTCDTRAQRRISPSDFARLSTLSTPGDIVMQAVRPYVAEIEYLVTEIKPHVIFCIIPDELGAQLDLAAEMGSPLDHHLEDDDEDIRTYRHDFHHCLKAEAMSFHTPIQLVLPSTFGMGSRGKATKKKRPGRPVKFRVLQDSATRAWNFFTAMYYKAGGAPWRLRREAKDYAACYAGVSFYRSLDERTVMTSIAEIFNERGEGIVVRGGQARISKEDRTPHLSEEDSALILGEALQRYWDEHKNMPARVVIHKSSYFTAEELAGFRAALEQKKIEMVDMLSIRKSSIRLFRAGSYPVLRGTHMALDEKRHLLYTRGSVPFYETYPGLYVPRAVEILWDDAWESRQALCREILALTKMNWNTTQFDMRDPITIHAARRVGDILKYIPLDAPSSRIARHYSSYM
jgi:hypothetical protein